jgi:hypothetical protein
MIGDGREPPGGIDQGKMDAIATRWRSPPQEWEMHAVTVSRDRRAQADFLSRRL